MAGIGQTDFSARLLDALEALRTPLGEGARTDVRAEPPKELADAFRALVEVPTEPGFVPAGCEPVHVPGSPQGVGAPESVRTASEPVAGSDAARPTEGVAGDLNAQGVEALPSPSELLQMQFALNMRLYEAKSLTALRDRAAQELQDAVRRTG